MTDDEKECAYIRLRGTVERFDLILRHRSEGNYQTAYAAVVTAFVNYQRACQAESEL